MINNNKEKPDTHVKLAIENEQVDDPFNDLLIQLTGVLVVDINNK